MFDEKLKQIGQRALRMLQLRPAQIGRVTSYVRNQDEAAVFHLKTLTPQRSPGNPLGASALSKRDLGGIDVTVALI